MNLEKDLVNFLVIGLIYNKVNAAICIKVKLDYNHIAAKNIRKCYQQKKAIKKKETI